MLGSQKLFHRLHLQHLIKLRKPANNVSEQCIYLLSVCKEENQTFSNKKPQKLVL